MASDAQLEDLRQPLAANIVARASRIFLALVGSAQVQVAFSIVLGLLFWEFAARSIVDNPLFVAPPSEALQRIRELWLEGDLKEDLSVSFQEFVFGYITAIVIGIPLGILLGLNVVARRMIGVWVDIFNALPSVALAPIFIIVWGIEMESKMALIAFVSVWTIILNTTAGFQDADRSLLEVARAFGANGLKVFTSVRIPFAVPYITVGLRIAIGRAVVGMVVGELFGAKAGLGLLLFRSRDSFDTAGIYATIIILAAFAIAVVSLLTLVENYFARWRVSGREG